MNTVGIIAEYNPFHNGHLFQLEQARKLTGAVYVVAAMSGDFMQRGTPAVYDKYMRAHSALLSGADLVIELPVFGSLSSAADFADCGVSLLAKTGVVDHLCFGSECGDLPLLMHMEQRMSHETAGISREIRAAMKQGFTWAQARAAAFRAADAAEGDVGSGGGPVPELPNDILAVEYLRSLKKYRSSMTPCTIKRCDAGYHSPERKGAFASATAVRRAIEEENEEFLRQVLPESFFVCRSLYHPLPVASDDFSMILGDRLLTSGPDRIQKTASMPEDLARKLYRNRLHFGTVSETVGRSKDRQYAYTRVSRCIMNLILGITKEDTARFKAMDSAPWIRILGFRKSAAPLLSQMKKKASAPLISKVADAGNILPDPAFSLFEKHLRSAELYRLAASMKPGAAPVPGEYTRPFLVL